MVRAILGVVVGYVVMFAVVFVSFSAAYVAMGAERAFVPGSYQVSAVWLVTSSVLGLAGAIAGGVVCALVARAGSWAPLALAGLVFVLGAAMAVPAVMADRESEPRLAGVGTSEAMMKARTPALAAVLNPIIGAAGVVAGARLVRRRGASG